MSYLTAAQLAARLNLGLRTVYALPIPQHRFGGAVRWAESDIEEYESSCRRAPRVTPTLSISTLKARSPDPTADLLNYFARHGLNPKPAPAQRRRKVSNEG